MRFKCKHLNWFSAQARSSSNKLRLSEPIVPEKEENPKSIFEEAFIQKNCINRFIFFPTDFNNCLSLKLRDVCLLQNKGFGQKFQNDLKISWEPEAVRTNRFSRGIIHSFNRFISFIIDLSVKFKPWSEKRISKKILIKIFWNQHRYKAKLF